MGLDRKRALSEHLGNVLSTVTDRKLPIDLSANQQVDYFNADIAGANDYYPFGMLQVNRGYSLAEYRFGFNGQEMVNEISGTGNSYTAHFWQYDPRLGRRWNMDPKLDAWESPYVAFANNPIFHTDILGDTEDERKKAVEKAKEWKNKSKGNKSSYGGKGGKPGEAVDCSGLVSAIIKDIGLPDPNKADGPKDTDNGVTNIVQNTTKVDFNDIQEGNLVTFNNNRHVAIVSGNIKRDEDGNVISFNVIGSQSSTGPDEFTVQTDKSGEWRNGNNGYWSPKLGSAYKWDKPDKPAIDNGNSQTVQKTMTLYNPGTKQTMNIPEPKQQYFKVTPPPTFGQRLQQNRIPIVKTLGDIIDAFGY
ncbi:MAG: NlpC/P60 family protein [candidate division Zixibacteria bacterium]|nr:NlpC/P60 family protein [candidate division Zixibacteria bacterium]